MAAVIKSHIYENKVMINDQEKTVKYVHAVYNDVVDSKLTDGIALNTIKAGVENAPAVTELRTLRTTCSKLPGQDKWAVRAVLRYINVA